MEQGWLSQLWTSLVHQFSNMTLGMALWMGFLLLTLVLMILMTTRWGGVKPIWKCVILSIFAHILLGGYAYGTKLIFTTPKKPQPSETISLNMIDAVTPAAEGTDHATSQANPWDQLDLSPKVAPTTESIDRLQPSVQKTITRTQPEIAPTNVQPTVPSEVKGQLSAVAPPAHAAPNVAVNTDAHRVMESSTNAQDLVLDRQRRSEPNAFIQPNQRNQSGSEESQDVADVDRVRDEMLRATERAVPRPLAEQDQARQQLLQQLANAGENDQRTETDLSETLKQKVKQVGQGRPKSEKLQWGKPDKRDGRFQLASAPRRLADGKPMPEIYSGRSPEARKEKATRYGGSPETERAVQDALRWLASTQEPDGSWNGMKYGSGREQLVLGHDRKGAGTSSETGLTGLSLLSFLAAGHSHLEGEYRLTVQKGLEYLLRQQTSDGEMAGQAKLYARMYCHAMATLAITETLAMTGDQRLNKPVQDAINYSLNAQHPTKGGWRYRPGDEGDMSQFGWQVLVIKSAEVGGIEIPKRSKMLMREFLRNCTTGQYNGLASYRPGKEPSATMTAEALVCRYFLHDDVPAQTANEASQYLLRELPGSAEENLYYWYYGTLAMFQTGGEAWQNWNHQLTRTLVASQSREGEMAGSWEPTGQWAGYGGRVYSTAMAALCLEVYYRYQTK